MLPPVKKDRVITHLPRCFSPHAALHTKDGFHPQVKAVCQVQKAGTVNFNIAKVIVVGDVAVGKTCLISRFRKGVFDKNYKATIGVDFEMERFEVLGVPFSLQLWDTAGQERFKCIASTYYRGAQAIIVVFDLSSVSSLAHARQWLEDAMKENDPSSVLLFLVGTKKDLSVEYLSDGLKISSLLSVCFTPQSPDQLSQVEEEAIRLSEEIKAEYWAVSAKSGDGVREFFFRVASLTFEANVLSELEKSGARHVGDIIRLTDSTEANHTPSKRKSNCC
ncbi:ras-related protein Rab-34 isoform X1 [Acanthopagrus latus]|uniref:ras-related protein Rab-34 isoform X1 n=1 Tax=Acanthopagrus latus TaxID=8177 RepID=UPI00187C4679|nr:ras-related protein Rab-34 isoform X1 [Acanthopagrus latus]XP_036974704.1 ras-related protein Rab-34 isoform X1 [Acanthopagrus latus]XP_036974705.1 ras-related protein Rab-34 isoform X1 [Acanthopagrus latus]XP_036974706.1 ras-related protein Rab-34 isoform X1 [Acanthopagrus latus]